MIKINLKHTKTSVKQIDVENTENVKLEDDGSQTGSILSRFSESIQVSELDSGVFTRAAFKILLILTMPIGLKVLEIYKLNQLKVELASQKAVVQKNQAKISGIKKEIEKYKYLKDKGREYTDKMNFLNGLAQSRLVIPKFLDQIQSSIPPSVWLKSIKIAKAQAQAKNKEKEKTREVTLKGESLNEESVREFLSRLERVFRHDSISSDTEDREQKKDGGVGVTFRIRARL